MSAPKTLYDKIWDAHVAHEADDGTCLLYIDRHLVHEVTSPQAFEGLRMAGRNVRAPNKTIAVPDHNVPTTEDRVKGIDNEGKLVSRKIDADSETMAISLSGFSTARLESVKPDMFAAFLYEAQYPTPTLRDQALFLSSLSSRMDL